MTQDEMKQAAARAAIALVPEDSVVGVGTGSTANYFIAELGRIRNRLDGAVASSEATAKQLKALRFKTPYEAIEELWKSKPDIFIAEPNHHMLGLNIVDAGDLGPSRSITPRAASLRCFHPHG